MEDARMLIEWTETAEAQLKVLASDADVSVEQARAWLAGQQCPAIDAWLEIDPTSDDHDEIVRVLCSVFSYTALGDHLITEPRAAAERT